MTNAAIDETFKELIKSCPHGDPNPQCPFESFRRMEHVDPAEICTVHNKFLMLKYHAICNRIRCQSKVPVSNSCQVSRTVR